MLHCEVSKICRLRFNRFSVTQFPPLSQRKLIYQCYLKPALLENSVRKSLIARVSRLASNSQWTSHTDYIPKITWSIYSLTLGPTEGSKIKRNSSGQSSFVTWQFSSCEVICITESISHSPSQARNQGGCTGCVRTPPQAPKVRILILNIQVKECSRLNWSLKLNHGV